jgi:BlaI family penicillinase repressor
MANPEIPRPTDAELAILRILWDLGPATVRQVHDVIEQERALAYTTTLKLLQIMTEKGEPNDDAGACLETGIRRRAEGAAQTPLGLSEGEEP